MKIHALCVTRTNTPDLVEVAEVWTEYEIEEHPDGFQESKKEIAAGDRVHAFAEVVFEVNEQAVMNALYPDPVEIPAEVVQ